MICLACNRVFSEEEVAKLRETEISGFDSHEVLVDFSSLSALDESESEDNLYANLDMCRANGAAILEVDGERIYDRSRVSSRFTLK